MTPAGRSLESFIVHSFCVLLVLASLASAQTLWLVDPPSNRLDAINPATGTASYVGSIAPVDMACGLAHDGVRLHALSSTTAGGFAGALYVLNPVTGEPARIGFAGFGGWLDFAWDSATLTFYAVNQNNMLYTLGAGGSAAPVVTTPPTRLFRAIGFDSAGTLFAADASTGEFGRLDKATGAFTVVGATGVLGIEGLAYDAAGGAFYATSSATNSLYSINPATGVASLIGSHGSTVTGATGLAWLGACVGGPRYQVNPAPTPAMPVARLTFNGVPASRCVPAVTTKQINTTLTISFSTGGNQGVPFEAVISNSAVVAFGAGGVASPAGNILNVEMLATPPTFFNGAAMPQFNPFPSPTGSVSMPVTTPATAVTMSMQMAVLTPLAADGFVLSQACQLDVR